MSASIKPKINKLNIIWLASYLRSGNTLLRTALWHCFGLRSASLYPEYLGGNAALKSYIGHVDHSELEFIGPDRQIRFPDNAVPLFKTHQLPSDTNPAIYVVRDGKAVSISLWQFYCKQISLDAVIAGQRSVPGTLMWQPGGHGRPNALLVKYEDMISDLPLVLEKISVFLKCDILSNQIPDRETVASVEGRWVRTKSAWTSMILSAQLKRFNDINGEMLRKMGYC